MDSVRDNPGELVLEETFTHSHPSWSSIVPYLLDPSNMIHGILPIQSMCLTIFSTIHSKPPSAPLATTCNKKKEINAMLKFYHQHIFLFSGFGQVFVSADSNRKLVSFDIPHAAKSVVHKHQIYHIMIITASEIFC